MLDRMALHQGSPRSSQTFLHENKPNAIYGSPHKVYVLKKQEDTLPEKQRAIK